MCIATHTCATGDAWDHAVEQVPLGITGAAAFWVPLGATLTPWETMVLSNHTDDCPHRRAEKPLMLALLALEATTLALQYDGPSTIYLADKELAERLDNRWVRWGSVRDPASRVLRKVFRIAHGRIKYKHHEAVNRVGPDPEQDAVHQGCWLAGQVAAGRAMEELSDIFLVDDHVAPVSLPDILLRARDGDT